MISPTRASRRWRDALRSPPVWSGAIRFGLPVGCLQAVVNQGDIWFSGQITPAVIAKTIASPTISIAVAVAAAASAHRAFHR